MIYEVLINKIVEKNPNFNIEKYSTEKMCLTEYQQETILNVLSYFEENQKGEIACTLLKDIISKSKGKLFELMVYGWLIERRIPFMPQVTISKDNCFKKNDYEADGQIHQIYFDVKQFGIGATHLTTFKQKLQEKFTQDIVTIEGNLNSSTNEIEKGLLSRINDIKSSLEKVRDENGFSSFEIKNNIDIEIRLTPNNQKTTCTISHMDMTEWAKNNKFYFMKHGSQFCKNAPYIIFCPFDETIKTYLPLASNQDTCLQLRFLARRIFIELPNINDRFLHEFDGKSQLGISISTASKKISAIVFLDVESKWEYEDSKIWAFINPNADNPLYKYQISELFRNHGAYIDEFEFDNY